MTKYTPEQIGKVAELSCFYVTTEGTWLRMQWTDIEEGKFCALDEDSGEEYVIAFDEVEEDDPHFEILERADFSSIV